MAVPATTENLGVAIVGIGCRYPGAHGPRQLWDVLIQARCTAGTVPNDRLGLRVLKQSRSPGRYGGFIDGVPEFDAAFFGISSREAASMDPQKRILLETVWEAFEDAGIVPATLAGSDTGVFIGEQASDNWDLIRAGKCDLHMLQGSHQRAQLPGRVSFFFDFRGPSLALETACAASLTAVHLAAEEIRAGRASVCVAGGTNVILTPDSAWAYTSGGALAADGRCKFADAGADGFVRSDGVGVVVLKRLEDALADGDRVYAVIRGGANSHDGRGDGIPFRPSSAGQEHLLRNAYTAAGVDPAEVDYVEAHGTGTVHGDQAELSALGHILGNAPGRQAPLLVGSIKTNFGHTEAAAGVAGTIKAALCLYTGEIPPSLHLTEPTARISWTDLALAVPTERTPLPSSQGPRIVGVSAYGISGAGTHVVLSGPPPMQAQANDRQRRPALVLALSADSRPALDELAASYLQLLGSIGDGRKDSVADVCAAAALRRQHLPWRTAVVGVDREELIAGLKAYLSSESDQRVVGPREVTARKLAFVFSGHGSQWAGMARELMVTSPVFAETMAVYDRAISAECGWSVLALINGDEPADYHAVDRVHPALFAVQGALHALWQSWGVRPDLVLGHSMGEVSAALAAGALSRTDAVKVICRRSTLLGKLTGAGTMAWVELSPEDAAAQIADYGEHLAIGVVNGPTSVVLSGQTAALDKVCAALENRGVYCRRVNIDVAAHSPQLDGIVGEMTRVLHDVRPAPTKIPMRSTVLNENVGGEELDATYWTKNLRNTVLLGPAISTILDSGHATFVEIAPHPVVLPAVRDLCGSEDVAISCQQREQPQYISMLTALGHLWTAGHEVDWQAVLGTATGFVVLPNYPWQHQHFALPAVHPAHSLLAGFTLTRVGNERVWEGVLDLTAYAYLLDHRVLGHPLMPGAGYLELVTAAVEYKHPGISIKLTKVSFVRPLALSADASPTLKITLRPGSKAAPWHFDVSSRIPAGEWTTHAAGRLELAERTTTRYGRGDCGDPAAATDFYRRAAESGNEWFGVFRVITALRVEDCQATATVELTDRGYLITPLLEGCMQAAMTALPDIGVAVVASSIDQITVHGPIGSPLQCRAVARVQSATDGEVDLWVADDQGSPVITVAGMRLQPLRSASKQLDAQARVNDTTNSAEPLLDDIYEVAWEPAQSAMGDRVTPRRLLILGDAGGIGARLSQLAGDSHTLAVCGERTRLDSTPWAIAPNDAEGFAQLLSLTDEAGPYTDIVHLWSLDATTLGEAEQYGCLSTATLARVLTTARDRDLALTLVTQGAQPAADSCPHPEQALLWGLGRVLRNERPRLGVRIVDLDPGGGTDQVAALLDELTGGSDSELAFRHGKRLTPRLRHRRTSPEPVAVQARLPARRPGFGEVTLRTDFAGVNFHDVLVTYGALTEGEGTDSAVGAECGGAVTAVGPGVRDLKVGDQVVALATNTFADEITTSAELVCRAPANMDIAESVTLPVSYVTALIALDKLAALQTGEKILIHAAAGGVGLAAVKMATARGACVYATAGSAVKRSLLRYLGAHCVADSRSPAAAADILAATGGCGVDVVLNTTQSGSAWAASAELLAPHGRLIDLTRLDILSGHGLNMRPFERNLTYTALNISQIRHDRPDRLRAHLNDVMHRAEQGTITPLPYQTFTPDRLNDAYAVLARGDHIGKVLIDYRHRAPTHEYSETPPKPQIRADAGYLVTGGLGDLGVEVARWLIEAGARHILLTGRTPLSSHHPKAKVVHELQTRADVTYIEADAADPDTTRNALSIWQHDRKLSVRGIVHTAGILDGCEIADLTAAQLSPVTRPKAHGAYVLAALAEVPNLDFLVFFSAGSALLGLPRLGAYAAANAYLDALAHHLRSRGVPATSIDWGYWSQAGMAARRERELGHGLIPVGMQSFTTRQGIRALQRIIARQATNVAVLPTDWQQWQIANPIAARSSLFGELVPATGRSQAAEPPPLPTPPCDSARTAAGEVTNHSEILTTVIGQIGRVLRMPAERVDPKRPLNQQGIDSLLAMELRVQIENDFGHTAPTTKILAYTPQELAALLSISLQLCRRDA
jgi:acyl transferase domain-containing protein/acyl carrier protein